MEQNLQTLAKKISRTKTYAPNLDNYIQSVSYERVIGGFESNKPVAVVTLSKDEIVSPELEQCIEHGLFNNDIQAGRKIVIKCSDKDLAFNQEEAMRLVKNHEALSKRGGEMMFEESVRRGLFYKENSLGVEINDVLVSFPEMMKVNAKLTNIANAVNKISEKNHFSPYEKYLLCHKIISQMKYYHEENDPLKKYTPYFASQSYIETVTKNAGCCVGKAEYLRALLSMVGIKSCTFSLDSDREIAALYDALGYPKEARKTMKKVNNKEHSDLFTNHRITLIALDDSKYGMHGVFAGDAACEGAADTIPLGTKLDAWFNYGGLYSDGKVLCDFLCDLPTSTKQSKDYSEYKQNLSNHKNVLGGSEMFNRYRHKKALEAFSRLEQTRISKAPYQQKASAAKKKIDEIYEKMYPATFGRILKGEISKITNDDLELLREDPKAFWSGVTMIFPGAFQDCTNIIGMTIPEGVKQIGTGAFRGCTNLRSITIPKSVKIIRSSLFEDCAKLANIIISDEVTLIEYDAFKGCANLKEIRFEYARGRFVDIGFEEFYAMAGVEINDDLNKNAIAKIKAVVSQRVASGELTEIEPQQKKKAKHSLFDAVIAATKTKIINREKISKMGRATKAVSNKDRV